MASAHSMDLARRGQAFYDQGLKAKLEATNRDEFVAIEPDSGDFFLGKTLSEAVQHARAAHPDRLPFVLRVGHRTAIHVGVLSS